jgi:hypothetical protein
VLSHRLLPFCLDAFLARNLIATIFIKIYFLSLDESPTTGEVGSFERVTSHSGEFVVDRSVNN